MIINSFLEVSNIGRVENIEFSPMEELKGVASSFIMIPSELILNSNLDEKRVSIFSYFAIKRGLDYCLNFSISDIIQWLKKKADRHINGVNEKIINTLKFLVMEKYLTFDEALLDKSIRTLIPAQYNADKVSGLCNKNRYAILYVDEVQKVMNYSSTSESVTNVNTVLLVFTFLRMAIYRRRNKLLPEEVNKKNLGSHDFDIQTRRKRSPEAFNCYYSEIAELLGISERVVIRSVEILKELDLIYFEELPRIKKRNKWITDRTIFCNAYKREGIYLLASGSSYYLTEIENKRNKMNS